MAGEEDYLEEAPDRGPVHDAILEAYEATAGEWDEIDVDQGGDAHPIDIVCFDFTGDAGENGVSGWLLLTKGMSTRAMALDDEALANTNDLPARRIELAWYAPEPSPEAIINLRWLAQLPFIDETWLGYGHCVHMPEPPMPGSAFKTVLLLPPVIASHANALADLAIDGDEIQIFCVHLISGDEVAYLQTAGLEAFLNLMDRKNYPLFFDPKRVSMV